MEMELVAADPTFNLLLAALPAAERARWASQLEPVNMPLGHVLYESGTRLSHVYFPTTSIVSLLYVMENGASAEIAVVGQEGIVGISLFMGGESTPSRAVVQSAGQGLRLKANLMMQEFNRGGPVMHLLLRYTQALITQMAQTAVCNRHHSLDQQLCRWLLLSLDRLYAGRAARRRHRGGRSVAQGGADSLPTWPHHDSGPRRARTAHLRVLCGGQEGIRSTVARFRGDLNRAL